MAELISGWQAIASTAIVITILISGISLGVGRAFSIKRLERFGIDEGFQSVVNAAILGAAVAISVLILQISSDFTPSYAKTACMANSTPSGYAMCGINSTIQSSFALSHDIVRIENNLGYYQTLELNFGNFSISPLANMQSTSAQFSNSLQSIQFSIFALALNAQLLSFISSNWFGVVFATGLVLRSIFLTRKFGAFLIASSVAFILFYPLMLLMFPLPIKEFADAKNQSSAFLSNSAYQTVPIIDLNDNGAIARKIYNMSFQASSNITNSTSDFTGDLTLLAQRITMLSASLFFYSAIVPFFALLITVALAYSLSRSLGGEIATGVSQI